MTRATVARAFASWRDDATRFRKFKSLCFKVANARLVSAFNAWRADADAARGARRATREADATRRRGDRRVAATALFAWRAEHEKLAHARRIVRNRAARITANVARECVRTWIDVVEKKKAEVANLKKCLTRKRVAQKWFLRWYWDAFDNDIQDALANILGTTESTMHDVYSSPAGPGGAPSAIRGMMAIGARGGFSDSDGDDDDDGGGGGGGGFDSDDSDDSDAFGESESSGGVNRRRLGDVDDADDIAEAADALFASRARGVALDPKNAGDVRKARRMTRRMSPAKSASATKEKTPGDAAAGGGSGKKKKKKKKERTPPTRPTRDPAAVTKPRVDADADADAEAASSAATAAGADADADADAWLDSPNDDDVDASGGAVKDARNAPAASDEVEPFNARIERVLEEEKNGGERTKAGDFFGLW
jgi:protein SFI1